MYFRIFMQSYSVNKNLNQTIIELVSDYVTASLATEKWKLTERVFTYLMLNNLLDVFWTRPLNGG